MTSKRTRAKRGEGDLLRDEILDATEALLLETGSEDEVSIRAVADRVGVTAPSIYRHFADKDRLLFEVCDLQFARFHDYLDARMAGHDDPVEAVKACGRAYIEFGLTFPEHYRIMFMGRSDRTPEEYADAVLAEHASFMGLVDAVRCCADAGRLERDPFETATILWATVHGITSLLIAKPNFPWPPVERLVEESFAALSTSLFTETRDDPGARRGPGPDRR